MAEKGAHLTQAVLPKPSIFEVIAQQTLSDTIHPAFRRILEFLGSSNPERYGWMVKWCDEIYLTLDLLLQNHYLSHYDGSFSEVFYGLRRSLLIFERESNLKRRGRLISLFQLVFIPYVAKKLDKYVINLKENVSEGKYSERRKRLLISVFLKFHSIFRFTWECAVLYYLLAYLSGKSKSHSPLFRVLGLSLCYSEEDELKEIWDSASATNRWFSPKMIGKGLLRCLEVGAFVLQFLQWWQAEQFNINLTALPVPPPPPQRQEDNNIKRICPICKKSRRLETLLPVSGYVFCFRCIMQYVQQNKVCPVTGYPASTRDLVRLYK